MNQFIKNIKSSAAKYRTQLLVLALAFVSACSPVKEEKVREVIEKDLPPFVKIAELKLGGCVEQESPYSRDWYVEAPFEVKFEIVETTYDPGYKKFDWRKDGKVHFVRLNQKKGTLIDKKGVAKLYYRENGSGEISERLSVQVLNLRSMGAGTGVDFTNLSSLMGEIQNLQTWGMGNPASEFNEENTELIVQGSDEDKAWKKGYNEMLSGFKNFFPGIWSDKDGVLIYGDNSEYYIVRFKDKSFVRRKWELKNDGIMLGRDGGGGQVASRIVRISDKEWVEQDVRISGFGSSPSYLDRDKLTLYQKQKNLQDRESASENIRKGIAGIWASNWYNRGAIAKFKDDGSVIFEEKNSGRFEKGTWKVSGEFMIIHISETEKGKSDWTRWQFIEKLDGKNFELHQVSEKSSEGKIVWKGTFLRSWDDERKLQAEKSALFSPQIPGEWTWQVGERLIDTPKLVGTPYGGVNKPRLEVITNFGKDGKLVHNFYYKDGSRGMLHLANTYEGTWSLDGDILTENINKKNDVGVPLETYRYKIDISSKYSSTVMELLGSGYPQGLLCYKSIYKRKGDSSTQLSSAAGAGRSTAQSQSQRQGASQAKVKLSTEESRVILQLAALEKNIKAAAISLATIRKIKSSSTAAQRAYDMKKKTVPNLEGEISAAKKALNESSSKINPESFQKYLAVVKNCENTLENIKAGLSEYSTLEEGIDSVKDLGNKILDLF